MPTTRQLGMAISAAIAGVAWGYLRARQHRHANTLALLQGLEWFVAAGGAATLIEYARAEILGETDEDEQPAAVEEIERITHARRVVTEEPAD